MDPIARGMSWTSMVTGDGDVAGLDEFNFDMPQGTQQIDEFPTEVEQADVQGSARGSRPRSSKSHSKRTKNFDPKEDVVVVSAWLNVSKDPVHRANQTKNTFWSRIHAYFEENKTTPFFRTESSIMHRWLTILVQVNKFCGCYDANERRNQSGATIQDKVSDACEMFKELDRDNKTFTLMHCWNKLKDEDKWKAKRKELEEQNNSRTKKQKVQAQSTPRQGADIEANDDVTETTLPQSEARKRPMGQKKAKEALRKGAGEACMEALDKMWVKKEAFDMEKEKKKEERHLEALALEKERLRLEEKKVYAELERIELDRMEKEDRIMSMDISSMPNVQKQYYKLMQEKILARRLSN